METNYKAIPEMLNQIGINIGNFYSIIITDGNITFQGNYDSNLAQILHRKDIVLLSNESGHLCANYQHEYHYETFIETINIRFTLT